MYIFEKKVLVNYFEPVISSVIALTPVILLVLLLGDPNRCSAFTLDEELRRYLVAKTNLTQNDFSKLENGRMVTKLLPAEDKREVAICGIIPIKTSPASALQAFQESMKSQNKKSIMEFGIFSNPPNIKDLQNLTLESEEIEDLKQCRTGNCKLRLSANMIERFQKEVDWNAPDYQEQTNLLFRRMMLNYVQNYISDGDKGLIEYNDKREVVNLQNEFASLAKELIWINDYAPEFSKYLQDFSAAEPPNIKKSISWSKLKFGLKPVISITQTLTYAPKENAGLAQILYVTKQIYANHYFDSSLGLTALIKFPKADDTYLLHINLARSDSIAGVLGKFTRGTVEEKAIEKLEPLLQSTKYLSEAQKTKDIEAADLTVTQLIIEKLFERNYFIWSLILIGTLFIGFKVSKQMTKRGGY